ncbi:MAG: hypothetical protein DRI86_11070, partial [Bacteroidetes bacterium]
AVAGFDSDTNAQNVGAMLGAIVGKRKMEDKWLIPVSEDIDSSEPNLDGYTYDTFTQKVIGVGKEIILANNGDNRSSSVEVYGIPNHNKDIVIANFELNENDTYPYTINVVDEGGHKYSLSNNLTINYTVTLGENISDIIFEPNYNVEQDVWPVNQTNDIGLFNITNTGTIALDIKIKVNQTQQGWTLECGNQTSGTWLVVNTTYQTIYNNLMPNDSFQVWCRMDVDNPDEEYNGKILFNY